MCQWAQSVGELEAFNTDAGETNAILQALCHKNGYSFVDNTRELIGMLNADGVHPTKRGSQSPPSDCGPPDACGVTSTVSPQSEGVVLRKGSSAADTSASTPRGDLRVEKEVRVENKKGRSNKKPVSPALVSGASGHRKVKKTGRTAVPLGSAAFEQSTAFACGPPDACGVTSMMSPQSEGVVLRMDHSAADTSTSSPRGEDPEQEQKATSAKLSHRHICTDRPDSVTITN
ncbi:hypothetical protein HPB51_029471 [Rhipicephalus microplus]|uniref:Uncharacterized protein n=1 Tax=Rhipicephalus microplus TaxID=6941 RepID=A0A9J6CUG5_RHIMP|nr:hypothetical protein HPB51_029471 [Rhipicephalus microplus]